MSDTNADLPAEIQSWIGQKRYEVQGEFDVERGYIFTSCASVENGNPLFWDEKAAQELTGGWIAPPTMISVWFRPHHWAPGRTAQALPLLVHFDLKEKLGLGRFWVIDVEYVNQHGESVGTESYTGFGYRREA